jgi:hypothetical protein
MAITYPRLRLVVAGRIGGWLLDNVLWSRYMSFQFALCAPAEVVKHAYWTCQQLLISGSACRTARNGVTQYTHKARNLQRAITTFVSRS